MAGVIRFPRLEDWLEWHQSLHPNAIELGLERVARVLQRTGWRAPARPVITVGGTNGKGSCVALLDAMLEYKAYHGLLPTINLKVGAISVPSESLIGLIVSVICVAILMIVFRYTKIGLAMRATAEDLQVVQSVGIRATTVYAVSWVIASVVGVIGGILLGGVSGANMELANIGLKAFAVVLLGGVNSIGGAIVGGIILGMLENVADGYLDPLLPGGALAQVFPFFVMNIVLIFRPYGLFGLVRIERV